MATDLRQIAEQADRNTESILSLQPTIAQNFSATRDNLVKIVTNTDQVATVAKNVSDNLDKINANVVSIDATSAASSANAVAINNNVDNIGINTTSIASNSLAVGGLSTQVNSNISSISGNTTAINGIGADLFVDTGLASALFPYAAVTAGSTKSELTSAVVEYEGYSRPEVIPNISININTQTELPFPTEALEITCLSELPPANILDYPSISWTSMKSRLFWSIQTELLSNGTETHGITLNPYLVPHPDWQLNAIAGGTWSSDPHLLPVFSPGNVRCDQSVHSIVYDIVADPLNVDGGYVPTQGLKRYWNRSMLSSFVYPMVYRVTILCKYFMYAFSGVDAGHFFDSTSEDVIYARTLNAYNNPLDPLGALPPGGPVLFGTNVGAVRSVDVNQPINMIGNQYHFHSTPISIQSFGPFSRFDLF